MKKDFARILVPMSLSILFLLLSRGVTVQAAPQWRCTLDVSGCLLLDANCTAAGLFGGPCDPATCEPQANRDCFAATPTPTNAPVPTATPTPSPTRAPTPTPVGPTPTIAPTPPPRCASGAIDTGIGCIPYSDQGAFTKTISKIIVELAGGIAIVILLIGAVQYITASGDPDSIDEAKQKISAAVSGLLFIIFSVLILRVVGIDILGLDQLGILRPFGSGVVTP